MVAPICHSSRTDRALHLRMDRYWTQLPCALDRTDDWKLFGRNSKLVSPFNSTLLSASDASAAPYTSPVSITLSLRTVVCNSILGTYRSAE